MVPSWLVLAADPRLARVVDPETEHGGGNVVEPLSRVDPALGAIVGGEIAVSDRLLHAHLGPVLGDLPCANVAAVPLEDAWQLKGPELEEEAVEKPVLGEDLRRRDGEADIEDVLEDGTRESEALVHLPDLPIGGYPAAERLVVDRVDGLRALEEIAALAPEVRVEIVHHLRERFLHQADRDDGAVVRARVVAHLDLDVVDGGAVDLRVGRVPEHAVDAAEIALSDRVEQVMDVHVLRELLYPVDDLGACLLVKIRSPEPERRAPAARAPVLVGMRDQHVEGVLEAHGPETGRQHRPPAPRRLVVDAPHRLAHAIGLGVRLGWSLHALSSTQVTSPSTNRLSRESGRSP